MPDGADMSLIQTTRVEAAVRALREGRMIILVDDEDRENEGDLVCAADHATPETVNFMATHGRGLICCALAPEIVDRLELPLMVAPERNKSGFGTGFTVSVEAADGVTTGISAHDRAHTIKRLADPTSGPRDFARPGHVFPLRARPGGVLERGGQTEGSVDLCKLAGVTPAAVICEVMKDDGTMARRPDLDRFAAEHDLVVVSVAALTAYRRALGEVAPADPTAPVRKAGVAQLPTDHGHFTAHAYVDAAGREHLALVKGDLSEASPLVRVHSECLTGDALGSRRCDCGGQLRRALARVHKEGGVVLYVRQEGRGIGLSAKMRAYELQEQGLDTYAANEALGLPADDRRYDVAAAILKDLKIASVRLLTNNPSKIEGLEAAGVTVTERIAHEAPGEPHARAYLRAKAEIGGHLLTDDTRAKIGAG